MLSCMTSGPILWPSGLGSGLQQMVIAGQYPGRVELSINSGIKFVFDSCVATCWAQQKN